MFAAGEELRARAARHHDRLRSGPDDGRAAVLRLPGLRGRHPPGHRGQARDADADRPSRCACTAPVANGTTELSWRVELASHVQLSGVGEVPPHVEGFTVPVPRDTTFVLTAYDALLGTVAIQDCRVEAGSAAPPGPLPRGAIVAFEGEPIPDGFARCDGSVPGVPDLRGRFIRGAGNGLADGTDGGGAPHDHDPLHLRLHGALAERSRTRTRPPDDWQETHLRKGKAHVHPAARRTSATPSGAEEHGHALESWTSRSRSAPRSPGAAAAVARAGLHHEGCSRLALRLVGDDEPQAVDLEVDLGGGFQSVAIVTSTPGASPCRRRPSARIPASVTSASTRLFNGGSSISQSRSGRSSSSSEWLTAS